MWQFDLTIHSNVIKKEKKKNYISYAVNLLVLLITMDTKKYCSIPINPMIKEY